MQFREKGTQGAMEEYGFRLISLLILLTGTYETGLALFITAGSSFGGTAQEMV